MSPLNQAGTFLIQTLFDLYIFILMLRILLQFVKADFYNPVCQFVVKATNPIVIPVRRMIPGFAGIDWATVLWALLFTTIKIMLIAWISFNRLPTVPAVFLWAFGDLISLTINVFFFAILLQVILSWIAQGAQNPLIPLLYQLTNPIMKPIKRVIPPLGGFDITPIPAMILLQLLIMLVANPVIQIGMVASLR